jgi:hypothetical protein
MVIFSISQQMELYKSKKIMNYFVFKHPIFGFQRIGRRAVLNMVCQRKKTFFLNFRFVAIAIYLTKRTIRNRQRHGLEEYEMVCLLFIIRSFFNSDLFSMH